MRKSFSNYAKAIISITFMSSLMILAPLLTVSVSVAATPTVIRVPDDYPTIQVAINATSNGDTIQVAAGTYYENVTIDKSLTLIGEDVETTIIDAGGEGNTIRITASTVEILRFTIRNSGGEWIRGNEILPKSGILLDEVENVNITNCVIVDNAFTGVMLLESFGNTISANTFTNNAEAIFLKGSSDNMIVDNNVTDNRETGIKLASSSNNAVSANDLTSNGWYGFWIVDSHNNHINNNKVVNNSQSGISLHDGADGNNIINNTVTNNGYGIDIVGIGNYLGDNIIENNRQYGVTLRAFRGNKLRNNDLIGNSYNFHVSAVLRYVKGIPMIYNDDIDISNTVDGKPIYYLDNQSNLNINPSTFSEIGYLAVLNSTNIVANNITLTTNNGQGVLFAFVANSTIENVRIMNNEKGIELYESDGNNILANNLTNNEMAIVIDWGSDRNSITNNVLMSDGGGIWLKRYTEGNIVLGNDIKTNEGGIGLSDSYNNLIKSNRVENGVGGIGLGEHSRNNTIIENTVINNTLIGIFLSGSSNNVLKDNRMIDNLYNFGVSGWEPMHFAQVVDVSNTVDGKPVYYWVNHQDMEVPPDAGYVALINSTNITVKGLKLNSNGEGVLVAYTTNSQITNNDITNNQFGVVLRSSSNNSLSENNITNNSDYGISIYKSSNNKFVRNFIKNTEQVYIYPAVPSLNIWDDGYPSGGNYWSDYEEKYPEAEELDGSGIWDTPYYVGENNVDGYPLMKPWSSIRVFDPTRDSFSFVNREFGGFDLDENVMSFLDVAEFIIQDPVYNLIDLTLPGSRLVMIPLVYTYLTVHHKKILNGHCYGMSYLVARWFNHPTERPGYPSSTVYSLKLDDELHRAIDYAQQYQLLDFYTFVRWFFATHEFIPWSNLKEYNMISNIGQSSDPTVMGIYDKDGSLGQGSDFRHAVVVYGIEGNKLLISDPNKVLNELLIDPSKDDLGLSFRIMAMEITDSYLFDKLVEWLRDSLLFWVHSPVELHVYDSENRHVGINPTGEVEMGFEAVYFKSGDSELLFIRSPSEEYRVKLVGTDTGMYNLTVFRTLNYTMPSAIMTGNITSGQIIEYMLTQQPGKQPMLQPVENPETQWLRLEVLIALTIVSTVFIVIVIFALQRRRRKR